MYGLVLRPAMYALFMAVLLAGMVVYGLVWAGDFFVKFLLMVEDDE